MSGGTVGMGLLYRCGKCDREMVLEDYHRGRVVPCPWCGADEDVPENLEFQSVAAAAVEDAHAGRWALSLSVVGLFVLCLPMCAYCWWWSAGRINRAREEQRDADPLLLNARVLGAVGTVLHTLVWALFGIMSLAA